MTRSNKRKDPTLTAAVLKVSLSMRQPGAPVFREIYEGVLRDFELSDADVDRYIEENRARVEKLARGKSDS